MLIDKWIIFDFDGTLADTLPVWVDTWNFLANKYGYKIIESEDYPRLKAMSSLAIKAELGIPWRRLLPLEREGRKKFAEQFASHQLYPGIAEMVKKLKQQGFGLAILTSNALETVEACLKSNHCDGVFNFIYAGNPLFEKGGKLKKLLKEHNIGLSQAIYVGDETRDIDAGRLAGIRVASVTWGVNTKEILLAHHPDFLAEKPEQLLEVFKPRGSSSQRG